MAGAVKVLYIAGMGRSGTTLVDVALGQLDGFCSVGEMRNLWERGFGPGGWPCGCGTLVSECPFWSQVLERVFGPGGGPDPAPMLELQRRSVRTRHLPRLLHASHVDRAPSDYGTILGRLYQAIAEVSGARVVVDSSKHPADAYVASQLDGVDLRIVHMVRDPRGVAYSWSRTKPTPEPGGVMLRHGPVHCSNRWLVWNAFLESALRSRLGPHYSLLRYEDFIARPRESLRTLVRLADEESDEMPLVGDTSVTLGRTHTVSGNPSRFTIGEVKLRPDEEWRRSMHRFNRVLATIPALPLMARYGYRIHAKAG